MLQALSNWLAATSASTWIGDNQWVTPLVQSIHILAIALVAGSSLMLDLRVLGLAATGQPLEAVHRRFAPWLWSAVAILAASGAVLILGEPGRELLNPVFRAKMVMVSVAVAFTGVIDAGLSRRPPFWTAKAERAPAPRLLAAASLALWLAIIVAGRWIAYTQPS